MMKIEFHPEVRDEIQSSFDWYNARLSGLGDDFLHELDNGFEFIAEKPLMWPIYERGFRRFLLKKFPFAIIYKSEKDKICVVAVMHLNRKPGYWKKRT